MTNIIVFGCQQIAVDFIKYLKKQKDITMPCVATYELPLDKIYGYESVSSVAGKLKLPVKSPKYFDANFLDEIRSYNPDYIFSIYYRKIFPKELLNIPTKNCINIHPGLLPYYRGPVPTGWAIKNGENHFGITIHYMDEGIDTGDILIQKKHRIHNNETGNELYKRAMSLGAKLLIDNFRKIITNKVKARKQEGVGSYYGKFKDKPMIDWQQTADDIQRLVRAHAKPYDPVGAKLFNKYVLINKVSIIRSKKYIPQGIGRIVDILNNERLIVSCVDGCVVFEDYEIVPKLNKIEKSIYLKKGNRFG